MQNFKNGLTFERYKLYTHGLILMNRFIIQDIIEQILISLNTVSWIFILLLILALMSLIKSSQRISLHSLQTSHWVAKMLRQTFKISRHGALLAGNQSVFKQSKTNLYTHPSKLLRHVLCFLQKHFRNHLGMYMDASFGRHDQPESKVWSPSHHHIAKHEMIFLRSIWK